MSKNKSFLIHDFHLSTANNKIYFNNKTEHLKHYDTEIVKTQNKTGLDFYDHKEEVLLIPPFFLEKDFKSVLIARKSSRTFNKYKISLKEISTLLHYSTGFNKERHKKKYVPSSGGFHSVETFLIVLNSDEIEKGIYYFNAEKNVLKKIISGDFSTWLNNHVFFQKEYTHASIIILLGSDLGRLTEKYGERAYRLSLLDVGHVSQNLYLCASALNLNICASAGYIESEIEDVININNLETPTFLTLSVGK